MEVLCLNFFYSSISGPSVRHSAKYLGFRIILGDHNLRHNKSKLVVSKDRWIKSEWAAESPKWSVFREGYSEGRQTHTSGPIELILGQRLLHGYLSA